MATYQVTLLPSGWQFETADGKSLMQAARAAGIALPASCRNGTCRTCISRLHAGSIVYRIEWPGLLPEEKRDGWILPCVTEARSDLTLETPGARRKNTS